MHRFAAHVAWQRLDTETVVVDLRSGVSIGLSPTAAYIWERLPHETIESIAQTLADRFHLDAGPVRADVSRFIDDLFARGLLANG